MKKYYVSFSGGVDSTAMLIKLIDNDYLIDKVVFADTLMEYPDMYDHINKIEKYINMDIIRLTPHKNKTWDDWFYGSCVRGKSEGKMRGFPLLLFPCYWSREAKFKPLDKYMKDGMRYIGITKDEPKRIKKHAGYIYPLFDWGMNKFDCYKYLEHKNLLSDIHKKFNRTGCWCCPKQSIKSLKILKNEYPDLWQKLLIYEKDSKGIRPNLDLKTI